MEHIQIELEHENGICREEGVFLGQRNQYRQEKFIIFRKKEKRNSRQIGSVTSFFLNSSCIDIFSRKMKIVCLKIVKK